MPTEPKIRNGSKSFSKLFEILELIASSREGLAGRDITERSGFPTSTTFRMLKFLQDQGYLRSYESRYVLGAGLVRLGELAKEQTPLHKLAHKWLVALAEKTMETVHLAALNSGEVCYFDKVEGRRSVRMGSLIGSTAPIYCTGVGKAILAFLPKPKRELALSGTIFKSYTDKTVTSPEQLEADLALIRRRGYSIDDCEHELGVYCIAAPILDFSGQAVAGISVSGSELYLRSKCEILAKQVLETARSISGEFSGR